MASVGLLILFLAITTIDAQNRCSDSSATCINVRECPPIIEILRGPRPLTAATLETLRNLHCGFQGRDPLVCCVTEHQPTSIPVQATTEEPKTVADPPDVTNHHNLPLLEHETCGPMLPNIVNGNKTGLDDFAWMALIQYDNGREKSFRCGGTIITKRYILTAAHCVTGLPSVFRLTGVRIGDHDISKERDCMINKNGVEVYCTERYQDFGIDSIHYHPEYTRAKLQNDIALIRLNGTIDFQPRSVRAICMPIGSAGMLTDPTPIVTGWGVTELGTRSQDLLQAYLSVMSNEQCREVYQGTAQIWFKQICAGGINNVDSCMGDSGGPLQGFAFYNDMMRMVQYGVVSYGQKQCGTVGYPGVYTSVVYYLDWILDTIRE